MGISPAHESGAVTALKVAVTAASSVSVKPQPPVPMQTPLQPEKTMPFAGVASRCTAEPEATAWAQFALQFIDKLTTVTDPLPAIAMFRVTLAVSPPSGEDLPPAPLPLPHRLTGALTARHAHRHGYDEPELAHPPTPARKMGRAESSGNEAWRTHAHRLMRSPIC